jgi:uncharacterized protein YecE (DUF72 family)
VRRPRPGRLFLGTSGYVYPHWRGRFYPRGLPPSQWLAYYARHFNSVELNNPFYRLPTAAAFRHWRRTVPPGFVFAVKASRFLTHVLRLREPAAPLRLMLRRARGLEATLGPVLFQLPARFHLHLGRLDGLLAALARQRLVPGLRAVLEVRHPSWLVPEVLDRLARAGVALCLSDWRDVRVDDALTPGFVYIRRHGSADLGGRYSEAAIRADARRIRAWLLEGRDVYVYFNNDALAHAVHDARRLGKVLATRGKKFLPNRPSATRQGAANARRRPVANRLHAGAACPPPKSRAGRSFSPAVKAHAFAS